MGLVYISDRRKGAPPGGPTRSKGPTLKAMSPSPRAAAAPLGIAAVASAVIAM